MTDPAVSDVFDQLEEAATLLYEEALLMVENLGRDMHHGLRGEPVEAQIRVIHAKWTELSRLREQQLRELERHQLELERQLVALSRQNGGD